MKRTLLWSLVAMIALASCQDDFINDKHKPNDKIGYSVVTTEISSPYKARSGESVGTKQVEIDDLDGTVDGKQVYLHTITDMVMPMDIKSQKDGAQPQSRGAVVTVDNIEEIGVTSIVWNDETWAATSIAKKLYMDDVLCEKSNGFQTYFYWPAAEDYIRFFAYYPYGAVTIDETDRTNPKIEWQVPATVTEQHDLLVASANYPGNYKSKATLNFTHAMTGVQFKLAAGLSGVKVNKVEIEGVYYKGVYTYDYDASTVTTTDDDVVLYSDGGKWKVNTTATTTFEVAGPTTASDGNQMTINDGENTFMMMPQDLPDGAKINVYITDANGSETLTASLQGKTWSKGTLVTYVITFNSYSEEYILELVDAGGNVVANLANPTHTIETEYPYHGGNGFEYYVRSTLKTTHRSGPPTYEPVKWKITNTQTVDHVSGYTVGNTYFSGYEGNGTGNGTEVGLEGPFNFGVLPGVLTSASHSGSDRKEALGNLPRIGTRNAPIDLSKRHGHYDEDRALRSTANCYIVKQPGYYMFPVVYGNAIKDGVTNENAYMSTCANETETRTATRYKIVDQKTVSDGTVSYTYNVLKNFKDHYRGEANGDDGNDIKTPWIADQAKYYPGLEADYTPASAELLWQDAACLLTDVHLATFKEGGEDRHFIVFQVHEESICEGNAVLAVRNSKVDGNGVKSSYIMWSWHIWVNHLDGKRNPKTVTNRRVLGNYDKNNSSQWLCEESDFQLAQYQIGYCDAETKVYAVRDGYIRFAQFTDNDGEIINTGANHVVGINFRVGGATLETKNNAPVFQWGRKDPILPANGNGDPNNKTWYDKAKNVHAGEALQNTYASTKNLALSIQNPTMFMYSGTKATESNGVRRLSWMKKDYANLWNANCNEIPMFCYLVDLTPDKYHQQFQTMVDIPVVKTVYDPCPVGYEMPRIDAFTGATKDGTKVNKGYYKYYLSDATGGKDIAFSDNANVLHHSCYNDVFQFAFYVHPKHLDGSAHVDGVCKEAYWTIGLGHRRNGVWEKYGMYGGFHTSGLTCIQWLIDDGTVTCFDVKASRLAYIRDATADGSNDPAVYTPSQDQGYWGTLRTASGSDTQLAFPIIPVKTGANPSKTEVSVSGNINGWIENDDDRIDITL